MIQKYDPLEIVLAVFKLELVRNISRWQNRIMNKLMEKMNVQKLFENMSYAQFYISYGRY